MVTVPAFSHSEEVMSRREETRKEDGREKSVSDQLQAVYSTSPPDKDTWTVFGVFSPL